MSSYKFHISKDQQENMKFCYLATFFVSDYVRIYKEKGGEMTNDCELHVLLLIFWNMKFIIGYGWKEIS